MVLTEAVDRDAARAEIGVVPGLEVVLTLAQNVVLPTTSRKFHSQVSVAREVFPLLWWPLDELLRSWRQIFCWLLFVVCCLLLLLVVVQMIHNTASLSWRVRMMQLIGWQNTWEQAPGVPATPSPP